MFRFVCLSNKPNRGTKLKATDGKKNQDESGSLLVNLSVGNRNFQVICEKSFTKLQALFLSCEKFCVSNTSLVFNASAIEY